MWHNLLVGRSGGNSLWWVWGIAAVVVVGGAVAVCVFINKKKKTDK